MKYLLLLFLIGCQSVPKVSQSQSAWNDFEFHSAVWVNIHHFLYNEAFRPKAHQDPSTPLSKTEQKTLDNAIAFYKKHFEKRDLLFDPGLKNINNALAAKENSSDLKNTDIKDGLKEILTDFYPIYVQHYWIEQDSRNKKWISATVDNLNKYGQPIKVRLEKILERKFIDKPYRIDVVHEANWAGAYTSENPSHTTISSGRSSYDDISSLEMIFHETLHAGPFEVVAAKLEKELIKKNYKDNDQLWHAIHFFTVGEVVKNELKAHGIEYIPYAYQNGLFSPDRSWGKFESQIRKYWLPYMENKVSMSEALNNLINSLKRKSVSQVAEEWLKCPPPNPRRPDLCSKACCGNGSNWYVSCITFVGEISREANGYVDPDLLTGYSTNPGKTYGNPMKSWEALVKAGRAQTDISKIEPDSVVFYKIPTFPRGHVAIYAGEKDSSGEPLVITTGGYRRKDMRKEKISEEVRAVNAEILGWAKIK